MIEEAVKESILLGMVILLGTRGKDWEYFETNLNWWAIREARRN